MLRNDPHTVETILAELLERIGLDFTRSNHGLVERRINVRIAETRSTNLKQYCDYLNDTPEEWGRLAELLTINHSCFFRDPLIFDYLAKFIIPEIHRSKTLESLPSFRIWSAGCSTGDEPYSIAILLSELAKKEKVVIDSKLFATDIDEKALERAAMGKYNIEQIENVPFGLLEKYFTKKSKEFFISPDIKKRVKFAFHDLLDKNSYAPPDSIFGDFDIVLCRNVLIYFDHDYQKIIFNKLYKSLKHGGILVLGEAEVPSEGFKNKFKRVNNCCKIYQKIA